MKIVAISDTHNKYNTLTIPKCDVLIDCGDYSFKGYDSEIRNFYKWLNKQPAKYKISIQGNHELGWEANEEAAKKIALEECPDVILLHNSSVEIDGVKFYGIPHTPYFFNWAYNAGRTISEAAHYKKPLMKDIIEKMPEDINILISHGPPYEILDELVFWDGTPKGEFVGCVDLLNAVRRIKPDLHFFGHIHCANGEKHENGTSFYNVAVCDEQYIASNSIRIIDYDKKKEAPKEPL